MTVPALGAAIAISDATSLDWRSLDRLGGLEPELKRSDLRHGVAMEMYGEHGDLENGSGAARPSGHRYDPDLREQPSHAAQALSRVRPACSPCVFERHK
jgi:hypothetical protein